ncbi:MAG TPA: TetR/AcrR family transcriptional regulator [Polyangiaceae bacterium]|nr:TetR/AcrR family transcriptional regulator [Polyangiaceae bacterium]
MPRPKSDIDTRIVHAARERFLQEGVDGASLRAIAKDAGTSIGMVYYYFPTKDDLFLAVVEEVYERVLADMAEALSPSLPVATRLSRLYARVGQLTEEEEITVRLVVREALVSSARLQRLIERFQRGHIPLILRTVADGIADGTLAPNRHPLLLMAATLAFGAAQQILTQVLGPRLGPALALPPAQELPGQLVDMLLHGVGSKRG